MATRTKCIDCGANRGVQSDGGFLYCHACHKSTTNKSLFNTKKDTSLSIVGDWPEVNLPEKAIEYLREYYITREHINNFGIFWSNERQRIIFPYYIGDGIQKAQMLSAWARSLTREPKWLFWGDSKTKSRLLASTTRRILNLVIVEDVVSAIRLNRFAHVLSLGGTALSDAAEFYVECYKSDQPVIVWLDGDQAGKRSAEKIRKQLKFGTEVKIISTPKDPKAYTDQELYDILCK